MQYPKKFDVIVIGGGHAGTEAAVSASRCGANTLLISHSIETIGQMSCNPAIGGIGKGHIVREIDALGGIMGQAADRAGIHFRRLNERKGPAVQATRAQADRSVYKSAVRQIVENQPGLSLLQQAVVDLIIVGENIQGVVTGGGISVYSNSVVLTAGTFLHGQVHVGKKSEPGGRNSDPPSVALGDRLRELCSNTGRLKTGTPPRIDGKTIDFSVLEKQYGDKKFLGFSFLDNQTERLKQVCCYISSTNEKTHEIIRKNLNQSSMYSGKIEGIGPRYCPSVEDKVVKFPQRSSHQVFVEPEGLTTREIYPNGLSTSLPFEIQLDMIRSMSGFENAEITRPGYAIEYDFFDPRHLLSSLQNQYIKGLFFAGQINGTTGYEEAAGQGLVAGINAARFSQDKSPWFLRRDQSYIGVMIDDLVTRGVSEPYRMFTSRAEYRLQLREDNADLRLTEIGRGLGLVCDKRWADFNAKRKLLEEERERLNKKWVGPFSESSKKLSQLLGHEMNREQKVFDLLRRPEITYSDLVLSGVIDNEISDQKVIEQLEIEARYSGYIERQNQEIEKNRHHEDTLIPQGFDYSSVRGLSAEVEQVLSSHRPSSIGQASRISGITPAAISLLIVSLKKKNLLSAA